MSGDPAAYAWPSWAYNVRSTGQGWQMEISNYGLAAGGVYGRIAMNSLAELHHLALVIDVWDAEMRARQRREVADAALALKGDG